MYHRYDDGKTMIDATAVDPPDTNITEATNLFRIKQSITMYQSTSSKSCLFLQRFPMSFFFFPFSLFSSNDVYYSMPDQFQSQFFYDRRNQHHHHATFWLKNVSVFEKLTRLASFDMFLFCSFVGQNYLTNYLSYFTK